MKEINDTGYLNDSEPDPFLIKDIVESTVKCRLGLGD